MLLLYCVILFVFSSSTATTYSTVTKDGNRNHDFNVNTGVVEELVRQIKENELRMKQFEVRMAKQIETMQLKLKEQETENKMLRKGGAEMQVKLNQQELDIFTLKEAFMHKCKTDADEVESTKREEESQMDNQRTKKSAESEIKRRANVDANIAFTALLSADTPHLGLNQNVAFDNVLVNDGNAYNPHDGVFMAPCTGTYVFSTTVTINQKDVSHFGIAKNGNVLTTIYVNGAEKWYDSSAQTIVLNLLAGDDVSVKHTESDHTITGWSYSLFSGFLLYSSITDGSVVG